MVRKWSTGPISLSYTTPPGCLPRSGQLYEPLLVGSVPVYFGAPNAAAFAPARSFVDASSFDGPEALAAFLARLLTEPPLLAEYHAWRADANEVARLLEFAKVRDAPVPSAHKASNSRTPSFSATRMAVSQRPTHLEAAAGFDRTRRACMLPAWRPCVACRSMDSPSSRQRGSTTPSAPTWGTWSPTSTRA
jgi:hypothetical protein